LNRIQQLVLVTGMLLVPLMPCISQSGDSGVTMLKGAVVRGDRSRPGLALVFTGDEYADGATLIISVLEQQQVKASFFFTGNFYRDPGFQNIIRTLRKDGHYLGAHSDQHLLYCDWVKRDSLLVTKEMFTRDLMDNYRAMLVFGITMEEAPFFLPPYEWYNDSIASWTRDLGLQLVNLTYGTLSHADYTVPGSDGYCGSSEILRSILEYESSEPSGLNGFILLMHIGTDPERTDKLYFRLEQLVEELKLRGYRFRRIDDLLGN
jgi:peptidoglycan/xylan/chitin deacetylase (PgdA/CDA1 family)